MPKTTLNTTKKKLVNLQVLLQHPKKTHVSGLKATQNQLVVNPQRHLLVKLLYRLKLLATRQILQYLQQLLLLTKLRKLNHGQLVLKKNPLWEMQPTTLSIGQVNLHYGQ